MDLVRADRVPIQIGAALDLVGFAVQLHLKALHHLLNGLADVAQANVDPGLPDPSVGRLLDRLQQSVVSGVVRHRPRTVDDAPIDLRSKVYFHHIVVLQHRLVPLVGRPVRCNMVQRAPCRKCNAGLEPVLLDQLPTTFLQLLAHIDQKNAGLGDALYVRANLTVHLGSFSNRVDHLRVRPLLRALLLVRLPPPLIILVLLKLPLGIYTVREELG
mmetsp:Transcript_4804/g.13864  ORF Transcript_4804/g.13864 Transcript_4804/m.13864 type:complete len:215 (+) Transcript_4804:2994-3638(+)